MFCSVVYLDDMRERCCQCGTKTSKQDKQWVRNMSRSRKELVELIRKKILIWCFSLFNRLDVINVPDGFTTLVLAKKKWTTLRKRLIGNVPYVDNAASWKNSSGQLITFSFWCYCIQSLMCMRIYIADSNIANFQFCSFTFVLFVGCVCRKVFSRRFYLFWDAGLRLPQFP